MLRILLALTVLVLSTCAIARAETDAAQIARHKFETVKYCVRQAAIGEFDRKCDISAAGWSGAEGLWLPSVSQGARLSRTATRPREAGVQSETSRTSKIAAASRPPEPATMTA